MGYLRYSRWVEIYVKKFAWRARYIKHSDEVEGSTLKRMLNRALGVYWASISHNGEVVEVIGAVEGN